jgi:O-antigen/teichoic acid export membrane protein
MADVADGIRPSGLTGWLARHRAQLAGYASLLSGSAGRLVFSLVYFLVLANTLPVAQFGVFAAASAAGVVLSRIFGFGFTSPLYRTATVKPQLVGVYLAGFWLMAALSLPLVAFAAWGAHRAFFAEDIALAAFGLIIAAEVLLWRNAEVFIIITNGLGRFMRAALMTILGTALRMAAALGFAWTAGVHDVASWAGWYAAANAAALVLTAAVCWPDSRLRLAPKLYLRRMRDALSVAGGEIVLYAQMELDKVLMLAIAGGQAAGIYAIVMRLVDLTAIPVRAFNTLLVQAMMRDPAALASPARKALTEAGIAAISTLGMALLALALWWKPDLLGKSVAVAAPVAAFALALPALRNLTEYHSELLYARGQTVTRAVLLIAMGVIKIAGMVLLLSEATAPQTTILIMTGVLAVIYLVSSMATYSLMRRRAERF